MTHGTSERAGLHALWLIAALAACESSSSSEPAGPGTTSLCPDCIAGGETTDFAGDLTCEYADADLTPVQGDDALAREFGVDAVLKRLEQPLRMSLGWQRGLGGSMLAGLERVTEVEIVIEVQGLSRGEWPGSSPPCDDFLQLDANIELSTADGALSGRFERPFRIRRGSSVATLSAGGFMNSDAPLDLRDFSGALGLKLDPERAHAGSVGFALSVYPDVTFGGLSIEVQYFDADGGRGTRLRPLRASWPSNGCDAGGVPVDPDAAINPSDGRSARDYWEQQRARLVEIYPTPATWLDGSATQIELQLGELDGACEIRGASAPNYSVSAPLQIRSADGRVATTQPARLAFRTDIDTSYSLRVAGESTARAAFLDQVSAPSMDWANDFEATFSLLSSGSPDRAPSGDLQIIGFDGEAHTRLYLYWCSGEDCSTFPSPSVLD